MRVKRVALAGAVRAGLVCVLWLAMALQAGAVDGFLRVQGTRIVDGEGRPVLLRGMGLGGWMLQEGYMLDVPGTGTQRSIRARIAELVGPERTDAFYRAWLDNHTTKADIDALAAWGFDSVRLPMHYALYTLPVEREPVPGRHTWLEGGFRRTDALIGWARANGMRVVLDLHAAPGGQGNDINIADRDPDAPSLWDDPRQQDKLVALWRELARRYRDEPAVAAYDLLNEPNWGFQDRADANGCKETGNAPLRALLVRATRAIREVDTRHMVIVEGNCWGNNYRGLFDDGVWDDNLVLSFHRYWVSTAPETLQDILALRDRLGVPVWLGETGENSNDWFARNVALVEREGIGWAWWPLKKLRWNNPLQVVANDGYRAIVAYWRGEGPRPSADEATAALMRLATHDVRFEHNRFHRDVVDALFRAPHSDRALPFAELRIGAEGGSIAAADFDMGRDGVAYHDRTPANEHITDGGERVAWNPAMAYRNDGVDLGRGEDGRYFVAGMQAGEWLQYTIVVARAGRYALTPVARGRGRVSLQANGRAAGSTDTNAPLAGVALLAGRNTLRVRAESGPFDLLRLQLSR